MLKTLDKTISIGSTPTFSLYFDLIFLNSVFLNSTRNIETTFTTRKELWLNVQVDIYFGMVNWSDTKMEGGEVGGGGGGGGNPIFLY